MDLRYEERLSRRREVMEVVQSGLFQAKLREYEARLIREALQRARGNQARAARILGLPPTTLASQLRRLGIEAREFKRHASPEWPLVS
jgi:transcriptional regulator with GAF, ATPase, and Fis domain